MIVRDDNLNLIFCLILGGGCFGFTSDKTGLVLVKELSQDVLVTSKGVLIVILEVEL